MKKAIVGVMAIFLAVATVGCVGNKVCFERNYVSYPILEVKAEAKTEPQKSAEIKKPVETTVTPAPVASAPAEPKKAEAVKPVNKKSPLPDTKEASNTITRSEEKKPAPEARKPTVAENKGASTKSSEKKASPLVIREAARLEIEELLLRKLSHRCAMGCFHVIGKDL